MTESNAAFEFVNGTSGKADYLIVARKGRCVIGMKPDFIFPENHKAFKLGLYFRFCGDPKVNFSTDALTATEIAKTFPKVPLQNVDDVRGSFGVGSVFKTNAVQTLAQCALEVVSKKEVPLYFHTGLVTLAAAAGCNLLFDENNLAQWMQERWERLIALTAGGSPKTNEAAVKDELAKILGAWMGGKGTPTDA